MKASEANPVPTDTELVAFILVSMRGQCVVKASDMSSNPELAWYLNPMAGRSPREALEAAYAQYRTNLASAQKSPTDAG